MHIIEVYENYNITVLFNRLQLLLYVCNYHYYNSKPDAFLVEYPGLFNNTIVYNYYINFLTDLSKFAIIFFTLHLTKFMKLFHFNKLPQILNWAHPYFGI